MRVLRVCVGQVSTLCPTAYFALVMAKNQREFEWFEFTRVQLKQDRIEVHLTIVSRMQSISSLGRFIESWLNRSKVSNRRF